LACHVRSASDSAKASSAVLARPGWTLIAAATGTTLSRSHRSAAASPSCKARSPAHTTSPAEA